MRGIVSRIREATDEKGAYEKARILATRAVEMEKIEKIYTGEAINSLTRAGEFGSWLRKLYHGEKVSIHLHLYERLCRIVELKAAEMRARADHAEAIVNASKAKDAVNEDLARKRVVISPMASAA